MLSDKKIDVELQEEPAHGARSGAGDDDQVGYATFKAAQARGYEPVCYRFRTDILRSE